MAVLCPALASAQPCNQGLPTGNISGIVNTYYPGALGTVAVGTTSIPVDTTAIRGASTTPDIVTGDMLLVIQMQDAQFNQVNSVDYGDGAGGLAGSGSTSLANSGRYEYVVAQGPVAAGAIPIRGAGVLPGPIYGLVNSYTTAARDDTGGTRRGQRTFQVVRVSRRASGTLTATLTASPWNGRTGGILAVDVAGDLALGGVTVSVDGLGFRGGVGDSDDGDGSLDDADYMTLDVDNAHARKGEGIDCTPDVLTEVPGGSGSNGCPRGDRARGAPGNAGGGGTDGNPDANDENTGGGGGGNGGAGGVGGNSWDSNEPVGGRGGAAFPAAAGLLILGGGGGAGTSNNVGPGTGSAGGGMVFIRSGTVSGTGTISADGLNAACSAQDGGGGGGAGGSALFYTESGALTNLTVTATGGRGGDADFGSAACNVANSPHGPGGGGGGGVVFSSSAVNGASSVVAGQSGRTAGNIAYGSAAGSNGVVTTTLTAVAIPGVRACTVATRASIAGLRVGRGLVEFATSSQRDTLAFQVFATSDPAGRQGRRPLHARPVPAALPDTLDAVLYRVPVRLPVGPYVVIDEIETSGRKRQLGPFPAGDAALREAFERLLRRAAQEETRTIRGATLLTGRPLVRSERGIDQGPLVTPAHGSRPPGVKVETRGAGTATVTLADLTVAGLPPGPPETIRVFHLGQPVPHTLLRGRGGVPIAVSFAAEPLTTDFTDRSPYVVWRSRVAPPAPHVPLTRSGWPLEAGWQRAEVNAYYAPFVHADSDPWVWDFLIAGAPTVVKTFPLPELASGPDPVPLRIYFSGSSPHSHVVQVRLNGVALGTARFEGRSSEALKGTIPRALLRLADNELAIDYEVLGLSRLDVGVAFVDAVDLEILPAPPAGAAEIARIAPYDPRLPDLSDVDYLVVTHADFEAAAVRLGEVRAAEGRRVAVVDVERAYDALAAGAFEAAAVRGLLRRLAPHRSVVLFGDDTLDPRDYLGLGSVSFVPSLTAWDGQFGRIASENRYADQDGDGAPELRIGRLPANTPQEADTLVDKTLAGAPPVGPASTQLVAVDDHGPSDVSFRGLGERIAVPLPLGQVRWADVADGIGPARAALFDAWKQGPAVVQYFGHSGPDTWSDEHLLTPADAGSLGDPGPAPLLFTWTCQAQWYQYHLGPSVNEALLLAPEGGAVASFGPTGISDPGLQAILAERVLASVVEGAPLGESVRKAKAESLHQNPEMRGVVEGFTLLGDPELVVGGLPPVSRARAEDP